VSAQDRIRTSVVIPAYRAWSTLPTVLDALAPQLGPDREAILVEGPADDRPADHDDRWPWLRNVELPQRALPGAARNIGAAVARGRLLAFLDADAVPEPGWLERLERRLTSDVDAVGGAVLNGTPRSVIGTADYLLEFSELMPNRTRPLEHAATCNLLVRRSRFEAEGGLPEDMRTAEDTAFSCAIAADGRLAFAPDAAVHHLNRTALAEFVAHQRLLGEGFVDLCERVPFPHSWVSRGPALLLAAPLRVGALAGQLRANPGQAGRAVRLLPALGLGLAAWLVGVVQRRRSLRGDRR
jgi:mycofactocin glycosyltransferase